MRIVEREDFYASVAAEFELDRTLTDQTLLVADLDFDSMGMFDLVLFIEEVAEVQPEDQLGMDYPMLNTLGDAYAYCEALRAHSRSRSQAARAN